METKKIAWIYQSTHIDPGFNWI